MMRVIISSVLARVAVGLVVEVDDARAPLDQLELGPEARALADVDQRLGHDQHAAVGAVQVALEVLVGRAGGDVHHGVHLVGDVDGVGEGAVGLHRGKRVGLDIDLHDDVLQAVGGQHAEAQVHRVGDPDALVQADVRLDAVVELLNVDVEPGDQVRAHHLVAADLKVRDVVAGEVRAVVAQRLEQRACRGDVAHTGIISSGPGTFSWSQGMQWPAK